MSASHEPRAQTLADRLQRAAVSLTTALIAFVAAWLLLDDFSAMRAALAAVVTLPLWAALPGLLRSRQRTYAWMTLAVIPYLVFAIVEAIANVQARAWAGVCLFVGFTLFVTLIGFLRVARQGAG